MKNLNFKKLIITGISSIVVGALVLGLILNLQKQVYSDQQVQAYKDEVFTIGLLGNSEAIKTVFNAFKLKLDELSGPTRYEFEYLTLDISFTKRNIENAAEFLKDEKIDLIVTGQSEAAVLEEKNLEVPIIVAPANKSKPESHRDNIICIDSGNSLVNELRLKYFLEIFPDAKKILIVRGDSSLPGEDQNAILDIKEQAKAHNLEIIDKVFLSRKDLNRFILDFDFNTIDAVFRYPSAFAASNFDLIFAFQEKINKPIITLTKEELEKGGLISYSVDYEDMGALAGEIGYDILVKKVDPTTVYVQNLSDFKLGINKKQLSRFNGNLSQSFSQKINYWY